ncbi:MAG: MarR family transcriptional regulator [Candidatus Bathyarchaeota archaeon]|nr:MAG: MarR family transcriptional regulator [Candidatus Bathyarchaeota archaeon]
MSLEDQANLLAIIKKDPVWVREISRIMRRRTHAVVSLIKKMNAMGFVDVKPEKTHAKGRPRQIVRATMLGDDFLESFNRLKIKPLRSNKNDLVKAKRDAEYVNRLIARGKEPYDAFLELNRLVRYS